MNRIVSSCLAVAFILTLVLPAATPADQDRGFTVIVHPAVEGAQIPRAVLSSLFLLEIRRWGDGQEVRPVDRSIRSTVRTAFTREVLSMPVDGLQRYWNARIMKGMMPPPVRETDGDVVEFVARTKGAIGYVSSTLPLPPTVKVVAVTD